MKIKKIKKAIKDIEEIPKDEKTPEDFAHMKTLKNNLKDGNL